MYCVQSLRDTDTLPCAKGTRQGHHGNQASAKDLFDVGFLSGTRQRLCRVQNATLGKKKREVTAADGERTFAVCHDSWHTTKKQCLPCAGGQSTWQISNLCRVPWFLHTAKAFSRPAWYTFFAMCFGLCTQQRLDFFWFFLFYRVYGTQIILAIHIYQSSHRTHFI